MTATAAASDLTTISDRDFASFQRLIHTLTGIHLAPAKKPLLCGRLAKRLKSRGLTSYADYYRLVAQHDPEELETCINLITTNETCFFREAAHFDFIAERLRAIRHARVPLRVWSAACSTGEEPYTLAMVIADTIGLEADWEVLASDISTAVLARAAAGVYPIERADAIPRPLLQRYCLKGVGADAGTFIVDTPLRSRVVFAQVNLNQALPEVGCFDFIFLRNVMIYFPADVKRAVVARLAERLAPGGLLFVGLSETLSGLCDSLAPVLPTAYRRAES